MCALTELGISERSGVTSQHPLQRGDETMPRTGDKFTLVGRYASDCGPQWTIDMRTLNTEFPPCPHCHRQVNYTYVGPIP
jgi:hypothetical protein